LHLYTPKAGGPVDKGRLTQVGRALNRLGIEHIPVNPVAVGLERMTRRKDDWTASVPVTKVWGRRLPSRRAPLQSACSRPQVRGAA
jgi:hypothetical protein